MGELNFSSFVSVPDEESVRKILFFGLKKAKKITFRDHKYI